MTISLYDATIPSMIQILGSGQAWIEKAKDSDIAEEELMAARLIEDMFPFAQQVKWMVSHSIGAVEAVRKGVFTPDLSDPPETLEALRLKLGEAENHLKALSQGEIDSFEGRDMRFEFKDTKLPFTAEDYLLSFAQPNFYFHATTAYAILRMKGVPVGKRDFMGQVRLKLG